MINPNGEIEIATRGKGGSDRKEQILNTEKRMTNMPEAEVCAFSAAHNEEIDSMEDAFQDELE